MGINNATNDKYYYIFDTFLFTSIFTFQMNSRLNFYGLPGAGISSDWIRPRIANRFQLKKKVIFGIIRRRELIYV